MEYVNIKTGVVIDTPSLIIGKAWKKVEEIEEVEKTQNLQEESTEEFVEEEVDLNDLTNDQLEKLAEEQNIKLTTADKKNKDTRIAAIVAGLE